VTICADLTAKSQGTARLIARVAVELAEGEVEFDLVQPTLPLCESAVQPLEGVVAVAAPSEDFSDGRRVSFRHLEHQFIEGPPGVRRMA